MCVAITISALNQNNPDIIKNLLSGLLVYLQYLPIINFYSGGFIKICVIYFGTKVEDLKKKQRVKLMMTVI